MGFNGFDNFTPWKFDQEDFKEDILLEPKTYIWQQYRNHFLYM